MRVLQVSHNDAPPFPAVCRAHERALGSLGAEVTTVYLSRTLHGIPNESDDYLSMHAISGWRGAMLLGERFQGERFDLCLAHRYKACVAALLARTRIRVPRIIGVAHEFGFFMPRRRRWLRPLTARTLELAGVSGALADELERTDPLHRRAHVLDNVVDLAELDAARLSRQQARALLGISADATAIGVVGRLTAKKRPDLALDVFAAMESHQRRATARMEESHQRSATARMEESHQRSATARMEESHQRRATARTEKSSHASLHYLGTGAARTSIDKRAHELAISSHVRQHGFVPDAARVMEAFDAIVFTSFRDSFGMVIIEAMAAGVPVLAAGSIVARDVMGPLGRYFEPDEAERAGETLCAFLDMSEADRDRWRTEARARVTERYSVAALAGAYAAVLGTDDLRPAAVS